MYPQPARARNRYTEWEPWRWLTLTARDWPQEGSVLLRLLAVWGLAVLIQQGPPHAGRGGSRRDANPMPLAFPVTSTTRRTNLCSSQVCLCNGDTVYTLFCYSGREQIKTVSQRMDYITPHLRLMNTFILVEDEKNTRERTLSKKQRSWGP